MADLIMLSRTREGETMTSSTLHYEERGEGLPVVLLHGFPFDHTIWEGQLAGLRAGARVLAPDLPGFGGSPALPSDAPPTMDAYAGAVLAWADGLGLDHFVLGGHSMGGYIAFALARRAAARLAGLMLISTRPGADSAEGRQNRDAPLAALARFGPQMTVEVMFRKLFAPAWAGPELKTRVRDLMLRQPPTATIPAVRAMRDRPDSTPDLPGLPMPVLIVHGSDDQTIPVREADAMHAAIPGSMLALIPNAGHLPMLDAPDQVTIALRTFLGGCRA
jgi:pimeloyl-ACP methyl ester carboxylesterase